MITDTRPEVEMTPLLRMRKEKWLENGALSTAECPPVHRKTMIIESIQFNSRLSARVKIDRVNDLKLKKLHAIS